MMKYIALLACMLSLAGCASNNTVRGMNQREWNSLNSEQKQFVIDKAYASAVQQTKPMHEVLATGKSS